MNRSAPPSGPEAWLGPVLARHERALVGHATRLVGEAEAARDVVQDVFLRWLRRPIPPDDPRLAAWLHRVCRNRAIDHLRKERRMQRLDDPPRIPDDPRRGGAPPEGAAAAEAQGRLAAHVRRLPPRQQEVVWLRFQAGLSYREIADVTRTSVGNVGFVLHEALKLLRARLGEAKVASPAGD